MVTVGEILKQPFFSGCTAVAGLSGLGRNVRGWSVAERADFHLWIRGGEFIMSMLSFATDPYSEKEISTWVQSLIDSGASALGMKRSVYQTKTPNFLLELGDKNSFPIIEMDDDLPSTEAGEEIYARVLSDKSDTLKKAVDALSEMTAAAADDRIPGLLRQLALTLGNPILLETSNLRLAGTGGDNATREKRIMAARRGPDCLSAIGEKLDAEDAFEAVPKWSLRFVRHDFAVLGESFRQLTFPVEVSHHLYGYLSLIEATKAFDYDDLVMVRMAVNAIALIAQHNIAYGIEEEIRHQLFEAIITPGREKEAEERARLCGFNYMTPTFCVVAQPAEPEEELGRFTNEALIKQLADETWVVDQDALVIRYGYSIVVFCHILDGAASKKQKNVGSSYPERLEYILGLFEHLKNAPGLHFGAGRLGSGVAQLRASFEEAQASVRIAKRFDLSSTALMGQIPLVKYYSILDALLQDECKAQNFCEDVLGPLLQSKIKRKNAYCDTLEAYLRYGKNLSELSRNTGIHRNTVIYRIEKIQEILGSDMNDIQTDLSIWLALQIRKFLTAYRDGAKHE